MTESKYSSYYELEHANANRKHILPIRLSAEWPPQPKNDKNDEGKIQNEFVLKPGLTYLNWFGKTWNAAGCAKEVKEAFVMEHGTIRSVDIKIRAEEESVTISLDESLPEVKEAFVTQHSTTGSVDINKSAEEESVTISLEESLPLLKQKMENPDKELSIGESIELLTSCIKHGNKRAKKLKGKEGIIIIGNTGAGKSTLVNYLAGCEMESKSPKELGMKGMKNFIVVRSKKDGGKVDEIMPIGHTKQSKTFMPQIETAPDQSFTYCDCPGFLDNRGAEINIANAVNIRSAITQADSVKVLILINYHSLEADRGRGIGEMLIICTHLFGRVENLEEYKESLLIGVSRFPPDQHLTDLKEWIVEDTPPIMHSLAERMFIADPLDRSSVADGWDRKECLSQLRSLTPLSNPADIFQTVLTNNDEIKLLGITEEMGDRIQNLLAEKKFGDAASQFKSLKDLSVIDHIRVERLLNQNKIQIVQFFQALVEKFKTSCFLDSFSKAKASLEEIEKALGHFEDYVKGTVDIIKLQTFYSETEKRHQDQIKREKKYADELKNAQGQIDELRKVYEQETREMKAQLQAKDEEYNKKINDMEIRLSETRDIYDKKQEHLNDEMKQLLGKKDDELKLVQSSNKEESKRIRNEMSVLKETYNQKLTDVENEKDKKVNEQMVQMKEDKKKMKETTEQEQSRLRDIEGKLKKIMKKQAEEERIKQIEKEMADRKPNPNPPMRTPYLTRSEMVRHGMQ